MQRDARGVTNGVQRQQMFLAQNRHYPKLETPIIALRNEGGLRFKEMTEKWGTGQAGVHHGMAAADFDRDGDFDLVVSKLNAPAVLYENTGNAPRVAVRLKGRTPNTEGIGAMVKLRGGAVPVQSQEVFSGGR